MWIAIVTVCLAGHCYTDLAPGFHSVGECYAYLDRYNREMKEQNPRAYTYGRCERE